MTDSSAATSARTRAQPSPDSIHRVIGDQAGQLSARADAVRADADDSVHQMRVALRRIRSLLHTSPNVDTELGAELRWLAGVLGIARDAEVLAQRYRHALDQLAPQLVRGPVAERLVTGAEQRYRAGWAQALTVLDSPRYRNLVERLSALVAQQSIDDTATPASEGIAAAYRRVCKAMTATTRADAAGRDEALHRVRKAAKRLRYTADAAADAPIAEHAKRIQTLLGEHQDSVVSRAHLLAEADIARAAGEDTFTYGLLYQQEFDLTERCRTQLDSAAAALTEAMCPTQQAVERECGLHALAHALPLNASDVRAMLIANFGAVHINGRQMRSLMTALGWEWVNTAGAAMDDLPDRGRLVVVMRRGFTARINGEQPAAEWSHGRVCGYYRQRSR